jgi:hypothetical protein
MYMAPWAKLSIRSMLKRKAKPNATSMYIDDSIKKLVDVATISSTWRYFPSKSPFNGCLNIYPRGILLAH